MTDIPTCAALAMRARNDITGSALLDGEIFHKLFRREGETWSRDFADDVWHRMDPEDTAAYEGPPPFSRNADIALSLRFRTHRHVLTENPRPEDAGPDWRAWTFEIEIPEIGRTFTGRGHEAALAICDAVLSLHSTMNYEGPMTA